MAATVAAAPRIAVLTGNPKPGSRTAAFARRAAEAIAGELEGGEDAAIVELDLAEPPAGADAIRAAVASSDVAVIASPTFKATYSGLLKQLLDGFDRGGLDGVVAVPLMVHASTAHALAADLHLRPLLLELGAVCPTPAITVSERAVEDPGELLAEWCGRWGWTLRALAAAVREGDR